MTPSPDVIDGLPYVEGVLNYLAPMAERPMNLAYDPPPGAPRSTGVPEPHRVMIYDARPVAPHLSLDSEGLAVVKHNSAVHDFYAEDELRRAVTAVQNDYTVKSGPQRVRDLMGEEAEELLRHRFEIVNVWRPIRGPLRDAPLAVCNATTVAFTDFVPSDLAHLIHEAGGFGLADVA